MNKVLNVCLKNNTIESTDVFADIYSVAFMRGTPLENYNLFFNIFPDKVLDLFEQYFNELIKFAYKNRALLKERPLDIAFSSNT